MNKNLKSANGLITLISATMLFTLKIKPITHLARHYGITLKTKKTRRMNDANTKE